MSKQDGDLIDQLEQRRQDLEDINLKPDPTGNFLTVLTQQLKIDLPFRIASSPAAAVFLQSYHTGHSQALQQVRCDDLLTALFNDLHESKLSMVPTYEKELVLKKAGELDDEDLAMTETLSRRLKGLEGSIIKIAEMRENSDHSFEVVKSAADKARQLSARMQMSKAAESDFPHRK